MPSTIPSGRIWRRLSIETTRRSTGGLVSAYQSHEQILILMRPSRMGRIGLVFFGRPPMQSLQIYHVSPL
ncbi:MAG TPA: hypothetical protein PLM96_02635 [Methanoregulaceae archaeon]|nr:hypothetical protein [Methanolinea sp.]MCC7567825.1 hypothetical protein [Methanoregulaceae archaeon]MDD3090905.1 hypothetical protein [Methanoregulaceae archaeon]MDD5047830.1 hypothetical protein [Methanoregulaceae archaeon]MDD5684592.1 hypothetical protein [Methanoregulaceae archaeon]